jgi:homoserine O-acetyltransferase
LNSFDANNWIRQSQAMIAHDVSAPFGGSMEKAAAVVRAKVLVVVATQDHMVNPLPALEFAKLLFAPSLELTSDCGHLSPTCESARLYPIVARFLEQ